MKKDFQKSFEELKKMINQNIDLIRNLVEQAQTLEKVIENITEQQQKEKLSETRNSLIKTTDDLLDKTKDLFVFYKDFIEKAFKEVG